MIIIQAVDDLTGEPLTMYFGFNATFTIKEKIVDDTPKSIIYSTLYPQGIQLKESKSDLQKQIKLKDEDKNE